jgi:hypothetical protein
MSRESITRASFWRRTGTPAMQAQYPARVTYLQVGRFGELLIKLEMSGEELALRFSVADSAQILELLKANASAPPRP